MRQLVGAGAADLKTPRPAIDSGLVPQFEVVEDMRRVPPGEAGTLIPSWNTGYSLRAAPRSTEATGKVVRPGQRLLALEAADGFLKVRYEAGGVEGWLPEHILAPWPE